MYNSEYNKFLKRSNKFLNISAQVKNRIGYWCRTVGDILEKTEEEWLLEPTIGKDTVLNLKYALQKHSVYLNTNAEPNRSKKMFNISQLYKRYCKVIAKKKIEKDEELERKISQLLDRFETRELEPHELNTLEDFFKSNGCLKNE